MKLTDEQTRLLQDMNYAIESCPELSNDEYVDLSRGIQSLEEAWEEVKRLKEENNRIQQSEDDWKQHAYDMSHDIGRLEAQLQDALTVISNALTDVMDMLSVAEMERRDMSLCPQANMLSLHDDLQAAIDRIQGQEGIQG